MNGANNDSSNPSGVSSCIRAIDCGYKAIASFHKLLLMGAKASDYIKIQAAATEIIHIEDKLKEKGLSESTILLFQVKKLRSLFEACMLYDSLNKSSELRDVRYRINAIQKILNLPRARSAAEFGDVMNILKSLSLAPEEYRQNLTAYFYRNGEALQCASSELKNDKEIVFAALKRNGCVLGYISDELRNDKAFVLAAIKINGMALCYVSRELSEDREVVLAAVKQNGMALSGGSLEFRKDKEVMLMAVRQNGMALSWASLELRKDKEVVLAAVKQDGTALGYACGTLNNDKDIVLAAIKQNTKAIYYASSELKEDKEILQAIGRNRKSLSSRKITSAIQ